MAVSRLRLKDILESRAPNLIGYCAGQVSQMADMVNSAQERLLTCREAGDVGWYGCYAEMVFNVDTDDPYIVLPRGVARIIKLTACDEPIPVWNQFYEYLDFGSGNWPKLSCDGTDTCACSCDPRAFRRNLVCTFAELTSPGYSLRAYSNIADTGRRMLVGCKDANEQLVTTLDGTSLVQGCFLTFSTPFADLQLPGGTTDLEISELLGIQKDPTIYPVNVYEVNLTTAEESLLLTMEPGETVAAYSRYYLHQLPNGCCSVSGTTSTVQVKAMVKLDLVPVTVATDYLLIQSKEAVIAEMQAIHYSDMESPGAAGKAELAHRAAVRYLNGLSVHYEGKASPSVSFAPFGKSKLSNQRIGTLR